MESGRLRVEYADPSGDWQTKTLGRTTHADALHQAGDPAAAVALFREAEHIQQEHQPAYPRLYSLPGFRYCDLLLAQGEGDEERIGEVLERAEQTLAWAKQEGTSLLDIALNQLTLAHAHLLRAFPPSAAGVSWGDDRHPNKPADGLPDVGARKPTPTDELDTEALGQAKDWSSEAVAGLRAAGQQDDLPRGLLTQAALHRLTGEYPQAHQALQEVYDIAESAGMRLHLTDYHLESARLLLAEGKPDEAHEHLEQADQLIEATGYHRRDGELAELRRQLPSP